MTDDKNDEMIRELLLQVLEIPEPIRQQHRKELDQRIAGFLRRRALMRAIKKGLFVFFSLGGIAGLVVVLATSGTTSLLAGTLAIVSLGFGFPIAWAFLLEGHEGASPQHPQPRHPKAKRGGGGQTRKPKKAQMQAGQQRGSLLDSRGKGPAPEKIT